MFSLNDRVKETTASTGVGNISLAGAASGFQSFASGIGSGNTCYYTVVHQDINTYEEWEVGIGTVSGSNLIRNQVYQSSNNDAKVVFSSGTKDAFVTYAATGAVYYQSGDSIPIRTGSAPADTSNKLYNVGGTLFWDSVDVTGGGGGSTYYADTGLVLVGTTFNTSGTGVFDAIGIGTDSPTYKLDVAGNAGFDEYLYHNGDADTYIRFAPNLVNLVAGGKSAIRYNTSDGKIIINNTNQNVDFHVMANDGEEILATDAANNRVGVNTTTPGYQLDVDGTGNFSSGVRFPDGQVQIIAYTGQVGSSAPTDASYITAVAEGDLSNERTLSANSGLQYSFNSTAFAIGHASTGASSSNNSGRTYVQDVLLDGFGHVTGFETATETVTDTNTTYLPGTGLNLSPSTTFNVSGATTSNAGIVQLQDSAEDGVVNRAVTPNALYDVSGNLDKYNYWTLSSATASTQVQTTEAVQFTGVGNTTVTIGGTDSRVVTISGSSAGGGAPTDAQYVTLATDGDLSAERVLTAGTGLAIVDAGANGNVTLNASGATTSSLGIASFSSSDFSVSAGHEVSLAGGSAGYQRWHVLGDDSSVSGEVSNSDFVQVSGSGLVDVSLTTDGTNHTLVISGNSDSTKMSNFLVDGDSGPAQTISDGNTLNILGTSFGVVTAASATDTVTLDLPTKVNIDASYSVSGTGTGIDLNVTNIHNITLTGTTSLSASNQTAGQRFMVRLIQDSTGGRSVNWFSTINWHNGTVPTLTPTANKVDVFGFLCTDASTPKFDGFTIGKNISS